MANHLDEFFNQYLLRWRLQTRPWSHVGVLGAVVLVLSHSFQPLDLADAGILTRQIPHDFCHVFPKHLVL